MRWRLYRCCQPVTRALEGATVHFCECYRGALVFRRGGGYLCGWPPDAAYNCIARGIAHLSESLSTSNSALRNEWRAFGNSPDGALRSSFRLWECPSNVELLAACGLCVGRVRSPMYRPSNRPEIVESGEGETREILSSLDARSQFVDICVLCCTLFSKWQSTLQYSDMYSIYVAECELWAVYHLPPIGCRVVWATLVASVRGREFTFWSGHGNIIHKDTNKYTIM